MNCTDNSSFSTLGGDFITSHSPGVNAAAAIEGTVKWSDTTLDIAFANTSISGWNPLGPTYTDNFTSNAKIGVLEAFILIEEVCGLTFNVLADNDLSADILLWEDLYVAGNLGIALHGGNGGVTSSGQTGDTYCNVLVNSYVSGYETNLNNGYQGKGSDAFYTWIHEIGHSLGLGHPHDTGFGSNYFVGTESDAYSAGNLGLNYGIHTIMSYNGYSDDYSFVPGLIQGNSYEATGHAVLGAYDIYALQQMYGTNSSHNSGNTTYNLSDYSWGYQCIWDAGGTDTISAIGQSTACVIDLTAATLDASAYSGGGWSYNSSQTYGISIANGVIIENAIGGSGNDTLVGNSANNTLTGGAGNDTMVGGAGNDTMVGGAGNDIYLVDSASDVVTENENEGYDIIHVYEHYISGNTHFIFSENIEEGHIKDNSDSDITGNDLDNVFYVGGGNNVIIGGAGNDTFYSTLYTGDYESDTNSLRGGTGDDVYYVSEDYVTDRIVENENEGTDTIISEIISLNLINYENVENASLSGSGNLNLTGNSIDNTLTGNSGNNTLNGGAGDDTMVGGAGDDTYVVDSSSDVVTESSGGGTDTVQSRDISLDLANYGNVENLTLTGSSSLNLTGNSSNNTLQGNSGNNILNGIGGVNTLKGGNGNDTYVLNSASDVVIEYESDGTDTVQSSIFSLNLSNYNNIENLELTGSSNLNLNGNGNGNILTGNSGRNVIFGGSGNDTVYGGTGNDNLYGEKGHDTLYGGSGNDYLNGGTGNNTLIGGIGNDTYLIDSLQDTIVENSNEGTDRLKSAVSIDIDDFLNIEKFYLINSRHLTVQGSDNRDIVIGNRGNNTLELGGGDDISNGKEGNDTINGGAGNDTLNGGVGYDVLIGGQGNDLYIIRDDVNDTIIENIGEGNDKVKTSISFSISDTDNVELLHATGNGNIDLTGNDLDNGIRGNAGNNTLSGGGGDDSITGGAGNDILYGGEGKDTLIGGSGTNILNGGLGNDTYILRNSSWDDTIIENYNSGTDRVKVYYSFSLADIDNVENINLEGSGNFFAIGNSLDNNIIGNSGSNRLDGGIGNDLLKGGSGNDVFIFKYLEGVDRIIDFDPIFDQIEFDGTVFTSLSGGISAINFLIGTDAQDNNDFLIYDNVKGKLYYDADGVGGEEKITVATLTSGLSIEFTDFDLIV